LAKVLNGPSSSAFASKNSFQVLCSRGMAF
jgi:hypothetical protein